MAIDARIDAVMIREDGSGELRLIDRPARPGGISGCRGQVSLEFDAAPEEVTGLTGHDIWGGSGAIVLGSVTIARRVGYGRIVFLERERLKLAMTLSPARGEYQKCE